MKTVYVVGVHMIEEFAIEGSGISDTEHDDLGGIYETREEAIKAFLIEKKTKEHGYIGSMGSGFSTTAFIKEAELGKVYEPKDITEEVLAEIEKRKENDEKKEEAGDDER